MKCKRTAMGLAVMASIASVGTVDAAVIPVVADIAASTTWTNNNTYDLQNTIHVLPGATLTIEPGTVVASTNGTLAILRGAKIIARGTKRSPIIFTSKEDVLGTAFNPAVTLPNGAPYLGWAVDASHPTGRDPKTGAWREAANEWGNLTILGRGFVNNRKNGPGCVPPPPTGCTNLPTCNLNNVSAMEGLVAGFPGDPNVLYGGGDDNDDSGVLEYVSIRYGGLVIGVGNELNGLSLGGVGRDTEINYIEIMNNIDDGIEIWGGTVNLKHFSVWNIGDDSFDTDQGWRGKAQFGLIVQGYSVDAAQQSGVGDNCFEFDGAERAEDQPVTTAALYNMTVIGQPLPGAGDQGISYRDGARVQMRSSIFMNIGDKVLRNDITDGEGSGGYGLGGTLSYPATWTTLFNAVPAHANNCAMPAVVYASQSLGGGPGQGFLNEVTDTVFHANPNSAYSGGAPNEGSDAVSVTLAGLSNPAKGNIVAAAQPVVTVTRAPVVVRGGLNMIRVIGLDPRAANDAVANLVPAPNDGFFTSATYRGAFGPNENWLCKWTAADAFGFNIAPPGGCEPRCAADIDGNGSVGVPDLLAVINGWGACPPDPCPADLAAPYRSVGVPDLLAVINAWGLCP